MKKVFTTGQVAKICKVAPRTVSKWFDKGRLKGYRLDGSEDRRIPRENLIAFMQSRGMPLGDLDDREHPVLLVGLYPPEGGPLLHLLVEAGDVVALANGLFRAGLICRDTPPRVVVFSDTLGRGDILQAAALLDGADRPLLVAVVSEGARAKPDDWPGFDHVHQRPVDPAKLVASLTTSKEATHVSR